MRLENKSTPTLDLYSKADKLDIIKEALEDALSFYQWHYQIASDKAYRDVESSSAKAIDKVIKLLKNAGQNSLADDVVDALYNDRDTSTLTKDKVLSQAKKDMKIMMAKKGISKNDYSDLYNEITEKSFLEWCELYPLDEAPAHFDYNWEPPIY